MHRLFRHIIYLFTALLLTSCEKIPMIVSGPITTSSGSTLTCNNIETLIHDVPTWIGYTQYPGTQDSLIRVSCHLTFQTRDNAPYSAALTFYTDINKNDLRYEDKLYPVLRTNNLCYRPELEEIDIFHPIDSTKLVSIRRDSDTGLFMCCYQLSNTINDLLSNWIVPISDDQEMSCILPDRESLEQILFNPIHMNGGAEFPCGDVPLKDSTYLPQTTITIEFYKDHMQRYACTLFGHFSSITEEIDSENIFTFQSVEIDKANNRIRCYENELDKSSPDIVFSLYPNTSKVMMDWVPGEYVKNWHQGRVPLTNELLRIRMSPYHEHNYGPDDDF